MLTKRSLRLVFAISLILYPFVTLVMLSKDEFTNTAWFLIYAFGVTFIAVSLLWILGKLLTRLSHKVWRTKSEEQSPDPSNLQEVVQEILREMTALPLIGEIFTFFLAFYPTALLFVVNEEFQIFAFEISLEIIFYSMVILIWVELIEKWFEIRLCLPYLPIPIKYACTLIIAGNVIVRGIELLGLYDFG